MVLAELDVIGPEHLPEVLRAASGLYPASAPDVHARTGEPAATSVDLVTLDELDRRHVFRVLAATKGSREESARILGISRRTLTRMIQRWHWTPGAS